MLCCLIERHTELIGSQEAKVQKCKSACGLCKGANVGIYFRVPGLGPEVSGAGYQVRVRENSDPEPVPEPEDLNLAPDG